MKVRFKIEDHEETDFTFDKIYDCIITDDRKYPYGILRDDKVVAMFNEYHFKQFFNKVSQYMVFVKGGQNPKKIHDYKGEAEEEAHRLAAQGQNIGKEIYVLEIDKVLKSKVIVEEIT